MAAGKYVLIPFKKLTKLFYENRYGIEKATMLDKLIAGLIASAAATGALAQTVTDIQTKPDSSAYFQDNRGTIVRSPFGLCWRAGYWAPTDAVPGCDGELVPPVVKPTAPPIVTAPTVPAPAVPIPPKRCDFTVTLPSDQSFAFNKAVLTDAAKKRIDNVVLGGLAGCAKTDTVIVTGHTDRLGSQQYNQKLSEKRAEAIAAYLKGKGVSAPIETLGAGKTQPIKSCSNKLDRKKLIECLVANRRVVIEVRGTAK
jgi:OOP family OmpA-OmpF porin